MSDQDIVLALDALLGTKPTPSLLFGAPAVSLRQLESVIDHAPGSVDDARVLKLAKRINAARSRDVELRILDESRSDRWLVFRPRGKQERQAESLAALKPKRVELLPIGITDAMYEVQIGSKPQIKSGSLKTDVEAKRNDDDALDGGKSAKSSTSRFFKNLLNRNGEGGRDVLNTEEQLTIELPPAHAIGASTATDILLPHSSQVQTLSRAPGSPSSRPVYGSIMPGAHLKIPKKASAVSRSTPSSPVIAQPPAPETRVLRRANSNSKLNLPRPPARARSPAPSTRCQNPSTGTALAIASLAPKASSSLQQPPSAVSGSRNGIISFDSDEDDDDAFELDVPAAIPQITVTPSSVKDAGGLSQVSARSPKVHPQGQDTRSRTIQQARRARGWDGMKASAVPVALQLTTKTSAIVPKLAPLEEPVVMASRRHQLTGAKTERQNSGTRRPDDRSKAKVRARDDIDEGRQVSGSKSSSRTPKKEERHLEKAREERRLHRKQADLRRREERSTNRDRQRGEEAKMASRSRRSEKKKRAKPTWYDLALKDIPFSLDTPEKFGPLNYYIIPQLALLIVAAYILHTAL